MSTYILDVESHEEKLYPNTRNSIIKKHALNPSFSDCYPYILSMKKVLFIATFLFLLGCSNSIEDITKQSGDSNDLSNEVSPGTSEERGSEIDTTLLDALSALYEHLNDQGTKSSGNLFNYMDTMGLAPDDDLDSTEFYSASDTSLLDSLAKAVETAMDKLSDAEASSTLYYFLSRLGVNADFEMNNQESSCFWCKRMEVVDTSTQHLGYCWCKSTSYVLWLNRRESYKACPCDGEVSD